MEEPRMAIIKIPREVNPSFVEWVAIGLRKAIGGPVLIIPMNCEVLVGKSAKTESDHLHKFIHQMLNK